MMYCIIVLPGAKDGEMICCVCMSDSSEKPNEIVLCDNCGQGQ